MGRKSWDEYFLDICDVISERATCPRLHCGCILVGGNSILATGYNGAISGADHCEDTGCLIIDNHCVRTVHAERNAIAQAARNGTRIFGTACYTNYKPCWECYKVLMNAGVNYFIYRTDYYNAVYPLEVDNVFRFDALEFKQ